MHGPSAETRVPHTDSCRATGARVGLTRYSRYGYTGPCCDVGFTPCHIRTVYTGVKV